MPWQLLSSTRTGVFMSWIVPLVGLSLLVEYRTWSTVDDWRSTSWPVDMDDIKYWQKNMPWIPGFLSFPTVTSKNWHGQGFEIYAISDPSLHIIKYGKTWVRNLGCFLPLLYWIMNDNDPLQLTLVNGKKNPQRCEFPWDPLRCCWCPVEPGENLGPGWDESPPKELWYIWNRHLSMETCWRHVFWFVVLKLNLLFASTVT